MIDLHLHLDGSLRPETVRELLDKRNINRFTSISELETAMRVSSQCRNLNEYLKCFDIPLSVMQRTDEIVRCALELGKCLAEKKITYGEIRFAPALSTKEGLTVEAVTEAVAEGIVQAEKAAGIKLELILCCMRGASDKDNLSVVRCAAKYYGRKVCAIDLAGAEGLYPTDMYEEIFKEARKYDIPFTVHAGEAAGPESIWKALSFGASRIGHGIRCAEDKKLMEYLAAKEIPIEVCPTSNMQTGVYASYEEYPLKTLLDNGIMATLNTDNMTVSGTDKEKEMRLCTDRLGLSTEDINKMERYSEKAAFNYR